MSKQGKAWILRANAVYLMIAGGLSLVMDFCGVFLGKGPSAYLMSRIGNAAIGFVEAHALALILGVVLWNVPVKRSSHLLAMAVVALLGTCNLVFWGLFAEARAVTMGYVTTSGHWSFVLLQLFVADLIERTNAPAQIARRPSRI